jgi:hypothetical protein
MYLPRRLRRKELLHSAELHVQWLLTPDNTPREQELWEKLYEEKYPRPSDAVSIEHAA